MIPNQFNSLITNEILDIPNIIKIDKARLYLTQDEAIKDIDTLRNIILYAYAGKEYFEKQGINFETIFSNLENNIRQRDKVHIIELLELYHGLFRNRIYDNHLRFFDVLGKQSFQLVKYAYFSDFIVEKNTNIYTVVISKSTIIKVGDIIDIELKYLFPTLSPTDRHFYLIGLRSWNDENEMVIHCNGKSILIPLHKVRTLRGEKKVLNIFYLLYKTM